MKQIVALILCVMLVGCASPLPKMVHNSMYITVVETQNLPANRLGQARWVGNQCYIELREYPACLKHEVRHCLEGDWHVGRETNEDCY